MMTVATTIMMINITIINSNKSNMTEHHLYFSPLPLFHSGMMTLWGKYWENVFFYLRLSNT